MFEGSRGHRVPLVDGFWVREGQALQPISPHEHLPSMACDPYLIDTKRVLPVEPKTNNEYWEGYIQALIDSDETAKSAPKVEPQFQKLKGHLDVFPTFGPALRHVPCFEEVSLKTGLDWSRFTYSFTVAPQELPPAGEVTDWVRLETTEKGQSKLVSILWGTLVFTPSSFSSYLDLKKYHDTLAAKGRNFVGVRPYNIRVVPEAGQIIFWEGRDDSDGYVPTETWMDRHVESLYNNKWVVRDLNMSSAERDKLIS